MSLDNIQLPPLSIQELYKRVLTGLESENTIKKKLTSTNITFLGENKKHILVLVNNIDVLYLPDEELNFLLGILSACQLTMEDVGIINMNSYKGITYIDFSAELKAEKIFLFGVNPIDIALPLAFPNFQVQLYTNQTYLSAPMLSSLKDDRIEKGKLWICLKQIFAI